MRVLHIYSGNLYGGIETLLVTLARYQGLCPAMQQHFALCFEGRLSEELSHVGAPTHFLGPVRVRRPLTIRRARRALGHLLGRESIDVVVCHTAWAHAIFGPVVQSLHLPLVFWQHGVATGRHWLERWARRTQPVIALCNSRFTSATLSSIFPNTRSELLYNPVAAPEIMPTFYDRKAVRATLQTPEEATVIIQVSRMESLKGHALHLEALSRLKNLTNWVCWLVGGAQRSQEVQYLNDLKEIAFRLGLVERVIFLGERSDVSQLMAAADIYCQPNTGPEGFGITFIEALYAGLPVLTTAIGGACELINDACGVLVPPNDIDALVNSLQRLILDEKYRRQLGSKGVSRAREFCDPALCLQRLNEILTSVTYSMRPVMTDVRALAEN